MTAVVLFAVILDRPAFTLRAVGLAAFMVMLIKPYSVLGAGFQMSFAATTALISAHEFLNRRQFWQRLSKGKRRFSKPVLGLLFTSAIAGLATAPISAFHFNQISQFGLAANLLAVPIMGTIVMPVAVIAFLLLPFGLHGFAFLIMGQGIGVILAISGYFSRLEGDLLHLKSTPQGVSGLIVIGGLVLMLWQGKGRLLGAVVILLTIFFWLNADRPLALIDDAGKIYEC